MLKRDLNRNKTKFLGQFKNKKGRRDLIASARKKGGTERVIKPSMSERRRSRKEGADGRRTKSKNKLN